MSEYVIDFDKTSKYVIDFDKMILMANEAKLNNETLQAQVKQMGIFVQYIFELGIQDILIAALSNLSDLGLKFNSGNNINVERIKYKDGMLDEINALYNVMHKFTLCYENNIQIKNGYIYKEDFNAFNGFLYWLLKFNPKLKKEEELIYRYPYQGDSIGLQEEFGDMVRSSMIYQNFKL